MIMRIARLTLACLACAAAGGAVAAMPNAKPGLWETVSTATIEAGLPANMPGVEKMSSEQRARMQQSMAPGGGKPVTTSDRACMTAEMLDLWDGFAKDGGSTDCRRTLVERTPQHVRFTMVCGGGKSTGEGDFIAAGADRVIGKLTMLTRSERGDSKVNVQVESRWVGADCGSVKPGARQALGR
jgi:hypothetical protein